MSFGSNAPGDHHIQRPKDKGNEVDLKAAETKAAEALAKEVPLITGGSASENQTAAHKVVEAMVHRDEKEQLQATGEVSTKAIVQHLTNLANRLNSLYEIDPNHGTSWMQRCASCDPQLADALKQMMVDNPFAQAVVRSPGAELEPGRDTRHRVVNFLEQLSRANEPKK